MLKQPLVKLATFVIGTAGATGVTVSATNATVLPIGDFDVLVAKLYGTCSGTGGKEDVYLQTTDDGGTTWYDLGHFGSFSSTNGTVSATGAAWMVIPSGATSTYVGTGSSGGLAAGSVSGLPILDRTIRVKAVLAGNYDVNTALTLILYGASQAGGF